MPEELRSREVAIIGAGPSGLALAAELGRFGVRDVLVIDRDDEPGGIPRSSDHPGYGLRDRRRSMSGPAYAQRLAQDAVDAGAELLMRATATSLGGTSVAVTSPQGRMRVDARAVVIATGCRERPRSARLIPGDRGAGIMTTGQLQRLVHLQHLRAGTRAVVIGAEHVSYSAVLTLAEGGAQTVAMVTARDRHDSYAGFDLGARVRYRFPLLTGSVVSRIIAPGGRVTGVEVRDAHGRVTRIACDTVVTTGDWIAEHELARAAGIAIDEASTGILVDAAMRTAVPGTFAVGNVVHPAATADVCAIDGTHAAASVIGWLAGGPWPSAGPRILGGAGIAWASPGQASDATRAARGDVLVMAEHRVRLPRIVVTQGAAGLWEGRLPWAVPTRPVGIPGTWLAAVDPLGPDVTVSLA